MPRLAITNLRFPARDHRPSRARVGRKGERHETQAEATREDLTRARLIRKACGAEEVQFSRHRALRLAALLEAAADGTLRPETMASKVYMRRQRDRIGGALWKLALRNTTGHMTTATLIPRGWQVRPEELATRNPRKLKAQVRSALNRASKGRKAGFALGAIHGEWNPVTGMIQLHMHFAIDEAMVPQFKALRKLRTYRAGKKDPEGVYRRVRITHRPLDNLPYPLTYLHQSMWPLRWRGKTEEHGIRKSKTRGRIPEPYHTMVLLWLNRWNLKDITLLHGLSVTRYGLTPVHSYTNAMRSCS